MTTAAKISPRKRAAPKAKAAPVPPSATMVKTDATPYVHNRTGERYLARHVGLVKIGHAAPRQGWIECVMYQKEEKPSDWFCRDLATFAEQFTEARELAIVEALAKLDLARVPPRGVLEMWSRTTDQGAPILMGDITEHANAKLVGTDKRTTRVVFFDPDNRLAISGDGIWELVGDEVTV